MSLREAWAAMPTEIKIANARHVSDLDRACAALAGTNAYACEVSIGFDESLKECGEGAHSFQRVVERIYWHVVDGLKAEPSATWHEIAERHTSNKDILNQLAWSFI